MYHIYVDDKQVGQHHLVCSLMSGIFSLLPSRPKYMFLWDGQVVLNYIKSKLKYFWGGSSLHCLDTRYIRYTANTGDNVTFHFRKLYKIWRKGNALPSLTVYNDGADERLCVVKTLVNTLSKFTEKRKKEKTQLLLSFKKPNREVVSSTVSGCMKTVLELANINTEVLKDIQGDWPLLPKSV